MTRAKAAWLAAGVVVLAAVAYLVRRRRTAVTPVLASGPAAERVTAGSVRGTSVPEVAVIAQPAATEEDPAVHLRDLVADSEQPLATWARVAIVALALVAFFAVSLIATKQV